jgi:hypothetical protein
MGWFEALVGVTKLRYTNKTVPLFWGGSKPWWG